MDVAEAQKVLLKEAKDKLDAADRQIQCLYPWVLLRVLPKEAKYKGVLFLPDAPGRDKGQNKPVAEGIVLATWKPFYRMLKKTSVEPVELPVGDSCSVLADLKVETEVLVHSSLQPGDHVLFPAWAGQPAGFLDDKEFRLVQEISDFNPSPVPFAKIGYEQEPVQAQLEDLVGEFMGGEGLVKAIANRIMSEYYVIAKKTSARTISGV